jgi:mono/diheme cytochrome c family protein
MAEYEVLGLFDEATTTADAIEQLRGLGVPDARITVMSGVPYKSEMLGRPHIPKRLGPAALGGAIFGIALATFLTVGIFLLSELIQGGQPIIPTPPSLIVYFEATMLGTMWVTFFGLILVNGFPIFKRQPYDPRITEGYIGVLAKVDETLADQVENALKANGAYHMYRQEVSRAIDTGRRIFWAVFVGGLVVTLIVTVLFVYDIVRIDFPTQMANQDSIAYDQGPRLAAPAEAVPVQGPVLIAGQPATEAVAATADSLQRGKVLFGISCVVCHGSEGKGNGTLSGFFNPKPFDLTSDAVQNLPDTEIFLVITQGRGIMPSLAENLNPEERWDVVNFVRSLKK